MALLSIELNRHHGRETSGNDREKKRGDYD
jgi:hypothetical protein